jgi:hypothetical protein
MDDPSGDISAPSDGGGGFTGFLTSLRGVIAAVATLVIAISGLLTALKAAGIWGGDAKASVTATDGTTTDDDAGYGPFRPIKRPNGRVYFEGKTMYVTASLPGRPLLHLAGGEQEFSDIVLSARVKYVSGAPDFGVSFVCRYRNAANYYLLALLSNGGHNIVRYRGGKPTFLSRARGGGTTSEEPREVVARCLDDRPTVLSLSVNGDKVGSAQDRNGLKTGTIGIRLGSSESRVTVAFDELALR